MELWKGMLWLAFVLVSFTVLAELLNISLGSTAGIGALVLVVVFAAISYVGSIKGYQIGREIGERTRDEES